MKEKRGDMAKAFERWYQRGYAAGRRETKLNRALNDKSAIQDYLDDRINELMEKVNQPGATPADQMELMTLYETKAAVKRGLDNLIR